MSTIATSPVATGRPATVTAAAVLPALAAVLVVPAVLAGMGGLDPTFLAIGAALAALKLVAAVGLWRCRRWAAILGFLVALLDTLLALPSFFDGTLAASGGLVTGIVAVGTLAQVATLVLLVLPTSRRAYV